MSPVLIIAIVLFNMAVLLATYLMLHPEIKKRVVERINKAIDDGEDRRQT